MCEKAGTAAGAGAGGVACPGAVGPGLAATPAEVAAGVGAVGTTRLARWTWWSSKSRTDSAADGLIWLVRFARLVDLAGLCPSTRLTGMATTAAAVTPTRTVRRLSNLMTR